MDFGTLTFEDGGYYKGEFKDGKRNGLGELYFGQGAGKNYGDRYVGRFKDNDPHGFGKAYFASGSVSIRTFKNGSQFDTTVYDINGKVKSHYRNGDWWPK